MAAVGLSIIFQFLLYISIVDVNQPLDAIAQRDVCRALSWVIPYALFVLGGYYIVDDLGKEERTGTLNFIRLSPRPAVEILLGKLLGVPILPMLLVAIALPMHVITGLLGGVSPGWLLSYYLLLVFAMGLVYSLALLFGLVGSTSPLGKQQALSGIGFAGLALFFLAPVFMLWNTQVVWWSFEQGSPLFSEFDRVSTPLEWVYLPIAANVIVAHIFALGNFVLAALLTWQVLLRKFQVPQSTLVSKYISYVGVAYANVLLWGFFQRSTIQDFEQESGIAALAFLNAGLLIGLIFALAPSRQILLDWLRYRQHRFMDWVWNDNSPSVLAIAINFAIAAVLIVPWLFIVKGANIQASAYLLSAVSLGTIILIYATLVQIILSMRLRSPMIWAVGVVATIGIVPPIILGILTEGLADRSTFLIAIWTFLGIPFWNGSDAGNLSLGLAIGWAAQLIVLLLLFTRFSQNLKRLSAHRYADS